MTCSQLGSVRVSIVDKLDPASGAGPFNIELFAGSMTDNNATFFFDGAMSLLQPYIDKGQLVVQSGQTTFAECSTERWNAANAQNRADTILARIILIKILMLVSLRMMTLQLALSPL